MPVQESNKASATGFREVLLDVSRSLGPHHLPLDHDASDINSFLQADSTHHSLIKKAVQAIYRSNQCGHLDSPIDTERTFDALGKLYADLNVNPDTDVDQIDILEKFGQELGFRLPPIQNVSSNQEGGHPAVGVSDVNDTEAEIVSLESIRCRLPLK